MSADPAANPTASPAAPAPFKYVTVKKWNVVAAWAYSDTTEVCAICRNELTTLCLSCTTDQASVDSCSPGWGICGHPFHMHCIMRWLQQRSVCPTCDKEWDWASHN